MTVNRRLQNWRLLLNEFDFTVTYVRGEDNELADLLSRHGSVDKTTLEHYSQLSLAPVTGKPGVALPFKGWTAEKATTSVLLLLSAFGGSDNIC